MAKITLKGYILVPDPQLEAVQEALISHICLTRQEKGCLVFEVTQGVDNKNKFSVYEEFTDEASFAAHQVRVRESHWGSVSKDLARDYQITGLQDSL